MIGFIVISISIFCASATLTVNQLYDAYRTHRTLRNAALHDKKVFELAYEVNSVGKRLRLYFDSFVAKKSAILEQFDKDELDVYWDVLNSEGLTSLCRAITEQLNDSEVKLFQDYCVANVNMLSTPITIREAVSFLFLTGKCKMSNPFYEYDGFRECQKHMDSQQVMELRQQISFYSVDELMAFLLKYDTLDPNYVDIFRQYCVSNGRDLVVRLIDATPKSVMERALIIFDTDIMDANELDRCKIILSHLAKDSRLDVVFQMAMERKNYKAASRLLKLFPLPSLYKQIKNLSKDELVILTKDAEMKPFLAYLHSKAMWSSDKKPSKLLEYLNYNFGMGDSEANPKLGPIDGYSPFDALGEDEILKKILLSFDDLGYFISARFVCKKWYGLLTTLEVVKSSSSRAKQGPLFNDAMTYYMDHLVPKKDKASILIDYLHAAGNNINFSACYGTISSIFSAIPTDQLSDPNLLAKKICCIIKYNLGIYIHQHLVLQKSTTMCETIAKLHLEHNVLASFLKKYPYYLIFLELFSKSRLSDNLINQIVPAIVSAAEDQTALKNSIVIQQWAFNKFSEQVLSAIGIKECTFNDALASFEAMKGSYKNDLLPAIYKLIVHDFVTTKRIDISQPKGMSEVDIIVAAFKSNITSDQMDELLAQLRVHPSELMDSLVGTSVFG